ncbi:YggT family protein [Acidipropionibacterium jensenii]|uniref:YGGT family n=1 Tax=Acidipropionibacterium jensenii TaxID=1749 RepID=A0A3Q9UEK4_9ACTN|nr:YggT family protein [Acidipropionibacterium jensenii]AZZ39774.1 YggT family protein [Acidipropionibacterium jensenii]AZZ41823.1 YggT family protein [Acidipropionibacterium jensenii]MDN5976549.1 YggT family protein [Acidipropionibacterium jensenii]MDN5996986.1 YggT family protein [Acidipropionibacterium jensenii]MDN6021469.1 YggT family protein [Acidipropionibacterium jensenii]
MALAGIIVLYAIQFYMVLLVVRMIISWVPLLARGFQPHGVLAVIFELVYTVTDPPVRFFDRILPPVRLGGVALSLGFMLLFVVLIALQRVTVLVFF